MDELKISANPGDYTMKVSPEFEIRTQGPTLYIKTPKGVELCVACNEYAVAEHWVVMDGGEKRLGRKCLWCGARSS
jgi:hypothetical protein